MCSQDLWKSIAVRRKSTNNNQSNDLVSYWQNVLVIHGWPATSCTHIDHGWSWQSKHIKLTLPTLELSHPAIGRFFAQSISKSSNTHGLRFRAISAAIVMPVGSVTDLREGVSLVAGWSAHSKPSGESKKKQQQTSHLKYNYNSFVLTCFGEIVSPSLRFESFESATNSC